MVATSACAQASVGGLQSGEAQVNLANSAEHPVGVDYQVVLTKLRPGPIRESDIPTGVAVSTVSFSPLSRRVST